MGTSLYLIFITIVLLSFIIIGKTIYNRRKVTGMTGMMIAMAMGMGVGLTVGVIFGIYISNDFFVATVLGMAVGMGIGFLIGIPLSIIAVLDGMLSGIMGGMMGAMLGAMIAPEYWDAIVKIMFFLFIATFLILLYMIQREINGNKSTFYNNPFTTLALFGLLFIVLNQLGPVFNEADYFTKEEHDKGQNSILIQAQEYSFLSNNISVQAGEEVTLLLENKGNEVHALEIIGLSVQHVKQGHMHNHNQETSTIYVHAEPGERKSISFIPVEKGVYRFVCMLPGHKESGMVGTIKVL